MTSHPREECALTLAQHDRGECAERVNDATGEPLHVGCHPPLHATGCQGAPRTVISQPPAPVSAVPDANMLARDVQDAWDTVFSRPPGGLAADMDYRMARMAVDHVLSAVNGGERLREVGADAVRYREALLRAREALVKATDDAPRRLREALAVVTTALYAGGPDTCGCGGTGLVAVGGCNCGSPVDASVGYLHERLCGYEPCRYHPYPPEGASQEASG